MIAENRPSREDANEDGGSSSTKSSLRRNLTIHWPLSLLLLILIFGATRDIISLGKRVDSVERKNAQATEMLKRYGKQTKFVDGLKADLQKIAPTDPVAAKILTDFFPKPITPEVEKGKQGEKPKGN